MVITIDDIEERLDNIESQISTPDDPIDEGARLEVSRIWNEIEAINSTLFKIGQELDEITGEQNGT